MLGSFQRAHRNLRAEVQRLREEQRAQDESLAGLDSAAVRAEVEALRAQCRATREQNAGLQATLGKHLQSSSRDAKDIARMRGRLIDLSADSVRAREATVEAAQRAAEEQGRTELLERELQSTLNSEAVLEDMLLLQWQMLEDLAAQFSMDPPWRCGLCSCSNSTLDVDCTVCDSPKDGKTEMGGRMVEAYFEFRLHQEFLGRDPQPAAEGRLAALKIALGHRAERWIETEEVNELQEMLKDLTTDKKVDPVLQAEAAFTLFTLGEDAGKRLGRAILQQMGETSDVVRRMCRGQRRERVAILYQKLLKMKTQDLQRYNAWQQKMEQAQAKFRQAKFRQMEQAQADTRGTGGTSCGRDTASSPKGADDEDEGDDEDDKDTNESDVDVDELEKSIEEEDQRPRRWSHNPASPRRPNRG